MDQWQVCDDGWTEANTAVACRSVGCSATGASAVLGGEGYGEAFGGGTGQIWYVCMRESAPINTFKEEIYG